MTKLSKATVTVGALTACLVVAVPAAGQVGSGFVVLTEVTDMIDESKEDDVREAEAGGLFRPLAEVMPEMEPRLALRYARQWLAEAQLPKSRLREAVDTAGLTVAKDPETGLWTLRQTSNYTGSTYELPDWDGSEDLAARFLDDCAELQASNVHDDREIGGPTAWDEPE